MVTVLWKAYDSCDLQFPSAVAPEEVAERLQKLAGGPTAPLNVHLRQEVDRLNIVLRIARETLESLRLAIAGGCTVILGPISACCCLHVFPGYMLTHMSGFNRTTEGKPWPWLPLA